MSQIIFQVKIWWVEKISRNKIGEIKNILREKFLQIEIYQMKETKNVHLNEKLG